MGGKGSSWVCGQTLAGRDSGDCRLDGKHGAAIWCAHGVFAHKLAKIGTLAS